jgi:hypothetical protein
MPIVSEIPDIDSAAARVVIVSRRIRPTGECPTANSALPSNSFAAPDNICDHSAPALPKILIGAQNRLMLGKNNPDGSRTK